MPPEGRGRLGCAIGVMAKVPQSGRSKTRLCPPLHADQAAALSAAFLRDTTENIALAARDAQIAAFAAYAPAGAEAQLAAHLAPGTAPILADGSADVPAGVEGFGRCLLHAVQQMFARGHASACVLSSDTPSLPTAYLIQAAAVLQADETGRGRVVMGACADGGYYLLGMNACHAGLFTNIAWSTGSVAEATRARCRAQGLELVELASWYDVDDAASLATLIGERHGYAAPHTRAAIGRLGILERMMSCPLPQL